MSSKTKKELLASAPWRGEEEEEDKIKFKNAKLKLTSQPGSTPTMHVPRNNNNNKNTNNYDDDDDASIAEIDPELRYSFKRNFQVFLCSITPLFHYYKIF